MTIKKHTKLNSHFEVQKTHSQLHKNSIFNGICKMLINWDTYDIRNILDAERTEYLGEKGVLILSLKIDQNLSHKLTEKI